LYKQQLAVIAHEMEYQINSESTAAWNPNHDFRRSPFYPVAELQELKETFL
jgi:hypothetical protein